MRVQGHRGSQTDGFYENTIEAFAEALDAADGLETDAVPTADGDIFLVHDTRFDHEDVEYVLDRHLTAEEAARLAGRRLDQLTADEARAITFKSGHALASLRELFRLAAAHPRAVLNIELKGEGAAGPVLAAIGEAVAAHEISREQIVISSFSHRQLLQVRRVDPALKIGMLFLLEARPAGHRLYPWSGTDTDCYVPYRSDYLKEDIVQQIRPDFINIDHGILRPETAAAIRAALPDAKLMLWSATKEPPPDQNPALLAKLKDYAPMIDSVITNYPRAMTRLLTAEGLRP